MLLTIKIINLYNINNSPARPAGGADPEGVIYLYIFFRVDYFIKKILNIINIL